MLVEAHETARELRAELDSKMRALQLLIGQARHEIQRLEQTLAESQRWPAPRNSPDAEPETQPRWVPGSPDRQAELFGLDDQGVPPAEIARRLKIPLNEVKLIIDLRSAERRTFGDR
jgi:hypothetical protein